MSRLILVNLCSRKKIRTSFWNMFCIHTRELSSIEIQQGKKLRLYLPVQISHELISISWRRFLWQSKRGSAKKMVGFYEVHKSITWQMLIVLIKHSDNTTPALRYSMVCPTAKKKKNKLEGFFKKKEQKKSESCKDR